MQPAALFLLLAALGGLVQAAYPTKSQVVEMFVKLQSHETVYSFFNDNVSPHVVWTVYGTSTLSGVYNRQGFLDTVAVPLSMRFQGKDAQWISHPIIAEAPYATVSLHANGTCSTSAGGAFNYTNDYQWVARFGSDGKIDKMDTYVDTIMLDKVMQECRIPLEPRSAPCPPLPDDAERGCHCRYGSVCRKDRCGNFNCVFDPYVPGHKHSTFNPPGHDKTDGTTL